MTKIKRTNDLITLGMIVAAIICCWVPNPTLAFLAMPSHRARTFKPHQQQRVPPTQLQMGLLENLGSFLNKREGDFVKLEKSLDTFGPGPAILLYGCPSGVADDELKDMIEDGAPNASKASPNGVICRRIDASAASLLDMSVEQALEKIVQEGNNVAAAPATISGAGEQPPCPVIYFSGISNEEMMATYRIISSEIYEESGGSANAACAKAVPPAMEKPLRQVIEEITGDHLDAITPDKELRDYGT